MRISIKIYFICHPPCYHARGQYCVPLGQARCPRVMFPSRKIMPHFVQFLLPTCGGFHQHDRIPTALSGAQNRNFYHDEKGAEKGKSHDGRRPLLVRRPSPASSLCCHRNDTFRGAFCSRCHHQKIGKSPEVRNALRLEIDEPNRTGVVLRINERRSPVRTQLDKSLTWASVGWFNFSTAFLSPLVISAPCLQSITHVSFSSLHDSGFVPPRFAAGLWGIDGDNSYTGNSAPLCWLCCIHVFVLAHVPPGNLGIGVIRAGENCNEDMKRRRRCTSKDCRKKGSTAPLLSWAECGECGENWKRTVTFPVTRCVQGQRHSWMETKMLSPIWDKYVTYYKSWIVLQRKI